MKNTITKTNFNFPNQTNLYQGKVRDVYTINDDILIMIATDRISAFDHVLPKGIPYKGQVLNQIAAKFLKDTEDIVQNWMIDTPDPSVTVGKKCNPFKVEKTCCPPPHNAVPQPKPKVELKLPTLTYGFTTAEPLPFTVVPAADAIVIVNSSLPGTVITWKVLVSKSAAE